MATSVYRLVDSRIPFRSFSRHYCMTDTQEQWERDFDRRFTRDFDGYEPEMRAEVSPLSIKDFIRTNFISRREVAEAIEALRPELYTDPAKAGAAHNEGYDEALTDLKARLLPDSPDQS